MREKILAQLIAKYAGVSKTVLGLIADKLAKKVTEESGIDQAITDFDNAVSIPEFAADFQKEGDRRVGDAKKEWEKKNPPKKDPPKTEDPVDDNLPSDQPWLKKLMTGMEALQTQVATLSKEKAQGSIKSKAEALLKDVPASYWGKRALPEKEEELQAFVEDVTKDYTEFKQGLIDQGLMSATPPGGGGAAAGPNGKVTPAAEKALDADITSWAAKNKPADTTTKK